MARRDHKTLDMFNDWQPPTAADVIQRFEDVSVRAANLRDRLALGVSETLKGCDLDRPAIAQKMAEWLGEDVPKNMLDAYASQAREEHVIPVLRLIALIHATGDLRILQMIAELFEHSVVEDKFLPWIEVGQLAEQKEEFDRAFDAARRNAKARLRR